jgi:hypothetical protein
MIGYIIYLPKYEKSRSLADVALTSGKSFGWNLQLFEGVDGSLLDWDSTGLKINNQNSKCLATMQNPGFRGCFMSHYLLWNKCIQDNVPIGIFEHDIEFLKGPELDLNFKHILRLEGFLKRKPRPAGEWYEGARAYILKPEGAERLVSWAKEHGALPSDVAIGTDVLEIDLDQTGKIKEHGIRPDYKENSFNWNLGSMR